jgi:hypothetical protein
MAGYQPLAGRRRELRHEAAPRADLGERRGAADLPATTTPVPANEAKFACPPLVIGPST